MRGLITASALILAACGPTLDAAGPFELGDAQRDAIVGGTATRGDPNVFLLIIQGSNGQGSMCTATLIDRRTLLTAAHCVDPRIIGAPSVTLFASNAPTDGEIVNGVNVYRVVETRMHPSWNPAGGLDFDIAMALLERAPPVTPKPWNSSSISTFGGRPVRAVGYGTTGNSQGSGTKRTVDLTFRSIRSDLIYLGNQVNKGVCHGDSGGPTFHTFTDGIERVVGVHSFTLTEACVDGADTRVDAYRTFIGQWLADKESPSCGEDGRCAANCATPDIDCVCAADGMCTTACPDVSKDPDCPVDCALNNVCSTAPCPSPDLDCVAEGSPCTTPTQCVTRRCIVDPQHLSPYCSRACTRPSDCGAGFECNADGNCAYTQLKPGTLGGSCRQGQTWCGQLAACTGSTPDSSVCGIVCVGDANCVGEEKCTAGFDGVKICRELPKPLIYLSLAKIDGRAPQGCTAVSGSLTGVLGLLLALRRRRRVRG